MEMDQDKTPVCRFHDLCLLWHKFRRKRRWKRSFIRYSWIICGFQPTGPVNDRCTESNDSVWIWKNHPSSWADTKHSGLIRTLGRKCLRTGRVEVPGKSRSQFQTPVQSSCPQTPPCGCPASVTPPWIPVSPPPGEPTWVVPWGPIRNSGWEKGL